MVETTKPSIFIRLIALKKGLFALILLTIAVISGFSWRNYDLVTTWANQYVVGAEYGFVGWLLQHVAHAGVPTLKLIARVSSVYGTLLGVAAIGLWFGKAWADPLFITLVGALIPIEIYEVLHQPTTSKIVIFLLNLAIFLYLLIHWLLSWKLDKAATETV